MANKRDSARQKRSRENRARRAALAARTAGTAPTRPSRVAPSTAERLARAPKAPPRERDAEPAVAEDADVEESGGRRGRSRRGDRAGRRQRPPRPGDVSVDPAELEGSWLSRVNHVPGGTQVLMAGALTVVITVMMLFVDNYYPDGVEPSRDVDPSLTIIEKVGTGPAVLLLGLPALMVALAVGLALHRHRRRVWLFAAFGVGLFVVQGFVYYLFVVGFLGYALLRAARVEGPNEPLVRTFLNRQSRRGASAGPTGDDDGSAVEEAGDGAEDLAVDGAEQR